MIILMLIEVPDEPNADGERRRRQYIHDEIRGSLEYAADVEIRRLDVAGVDGVTEESILAGVVPVPNGKRRRPGVDVGCGSQTCADCYEDAK